MIERIIDIYAYKEKYEIKKESRKFKANSFIS